jgi:hypothetical protein
MIRFQSTLRSVLATKTQKHKSKDTRFFYLNFTFVDEEEEKFIFLFARVEEDHQNHARYSCVQLDYHSNISQAANLQTIFFFSL